MLRQTLEYELTLLRAQHGKQSAFTQQLQQQHQHLNEQFQQTQTDIQLLQHHKDQQMEEKVRSTITLSHRSFFFLGQKNKTIGK